MAHEFESGFFVTEPAWHGLGVVLQDPPTVQEAITAAGLDWKVELRRLTMPDGREVPNRAVVRSTDESLLGVVGPDYEPLQNSDALAWFQPFVDSGMVRLEAAGSLREGKRVWVLGRVIGSAADVVRHDRVDQFVLLANGHDGTLSIRCGFTAIRVVCQNTLTASLNDRASKLLRIRHTKNAGEALTMVSKVIDVARGDFEATAGQFRFLASRGCDEATLRRYVREVFAVKPQRIIPVNAAGEDSSPVSEVPEADENMCARIVAEVVRLSESGRGTQVKGVQGTFWGAYNSVTEYLTHLRGKTQDSRLDGQWFGQSAQLNARALRLATQYAQAA